MGRRAVEIEVMLLHILTVIALRPRQAEEALLEDRIDAIPERQGEAHEPLIVRDTEQAVLTPPIGARTRVVMREEFPRRTIGGVILAHGPPLALGKVRPPAIPCRRPL